MYCVVSFFLLFNFTACTSEQEQNMEGTVELITELNERLESGDEMSEEEGKEFAIKLLMQQGISEEEANEFASKLVEDGELSDEDGKKLMEKVLEGNGVSNEFIKSIISNADLDIKISDDSQEDSKKIEEGTAQLMTELKEQLESGDEISEEEGKDFVVKLLRQQGISDEEANKISNKLLEDGNLSEKDTKKLIEAVLGESGFSNELIKSISNNIEVDVDSLND